MDETQKANGTSWQGVVLTLGIALIAAVPPSILALAAYNKSADTHDLVNSRLSEILPLMKQGAADAATLAEKANQASRDAAGAKGAAEAAAKPVKK